MRLLLWLALLPGFLRAEPIVGPGDFSARAEMVVRPVIEPPQSASLSLPVLPQLKVEVDAVANQEIPRPVQKETAFEGLGRFDQSIQMSAGGNGPSDPDGPVWDGARQQEEEFAHEEQLVHVERRERKAEAVVYAHAEIPTLDYRRHRFNKEDAEEFLGETREFPGGGQATGREMLELLMTPRAVVTDSSFDPAQVDMSLFGKSDSELRTVLQEKDIPAYSYHDFLHRAFSHGLVYRVNDSSREKSYHGIPYPVREALGMKSEEQMPQAPVEPSQLSAFNHGLAAFAKEAESLPPKEELFEFTAQVVEAAIKAGQFRRDQLSEEFEARSLAIDFDTPSLTEALLTLLESSHGTPWFEKSLALCRHAVDSGALPRGALAQALEDL